ncbi:hypothetical protein AVEN_185984-1 [Araneus ventricosus]|uniref:Mariner Mos1 transposase n=1 Tax=Araneus ventricosus TaxID=182803 RepID=A0A4Y2K860_ARAVE|nr:hypothetical protein AVEN_185984-1 [Araneus ventricosus]
MRSMQRCVRCNDAFDATMRSMQRCVRCNDAFDATMRSMQRCVRCNDAFDATMRSMQRCVRCNDAFDATFVGDASWCYNYTPESKKTSMQWKHTSSPPPRKSKATATARKVVLSFFFDCRGPLLIDFLPQGSTINSTQYCSALTKLRKAIRRKRPGLLAQQVILLHDNARAHVSC